MRYSKSSTENGGYSAIGFWYENKKPSSAAVTATNAKKVKDIETLTGFDFFHNDASSRYNSLSATLYPILWKYAIGKNTKSSAFFDARFVKN